MRHFVVIAAVLGCMMWQLMDQTYATFIIMPEPPEEETPPVNNNNNNNNNVDSKYGCVSDGTYCTIWPQWRIDNDTLMKEHKANKVDPKLCVVLQQLPGLNQLCNRLNLTSQCLPLACNTCWVLQLGKCTCDKVVVLAKNRCNLLLLGNHLAKLEGVAAATMKYRQIDQKHCKNLIRDKPYKHKCAAKDTSPICN